MLDYGACINPFNGSCSSLGAAAMGARGVLVTPRCGVLGGKWVGQEFWILVGPRCVTAEIRAMQTNQLFLTGLPLSNNLYCFHNGATDILK